VSGKYVPLPLGLEVVLALLLGRSFSRCGLDLAEVPAVLVVEASRHSAAELQPVLLELPHACPFLLPGRAVCPALGTGGRWTPWHAERAPGASDRANEVGPTGSTAEWARLRCRAGRWGAITASTPSSLALLSWCCWSAVLPCMKRSATQNCRSARGCSSVGRAPALQGVISPEHGSGRLSCRFTL
jgi:hypothetical protein